MKNFQPGGLRNRRSDIGGRPQSDVRSYAPKTRDHGQKGGFGKREDRGGNSHNRESKSFEATCTTCGKSCDVPFRPDGKKPVLCRDCYAKKSSEEAPAYNNRPANNESSTTSADMAAIKKQLADMQAKLEEIVLLVTASNESVPETVTTEVPAIKVKKVAKKAVAKKAPVKKATKTK